MSKNIFYEICTTMLSPNLMKFSLINFSNMPISILMSKMILTKNIVSQLSDQTNPKIKID